VSEHLRMAYADPPYLGCCKLYDHAHHGGGVGTTSKHIVCSSIGCAESFQTVGL
jgi:hypothetical protein